MALCVGSANIYCLGDAISGPNSLRFTTKDRNQDLWPSNNCPKGQKGGCWYHRCHAGADPTGPYLRGASDTVSPGVTWKGFEGQNYSSMKIMKITIRTKND